MPLLGGGEPGAGISCWKGRRHYPTRGEVQGKDSMPVGQVAGRRPWDWHGVRLAFQHGWGAFRVEMHLPRVGDGVRMGWQAAHSGRGEGWHFR
jgi:hypothetical protein